MEDSFRVRVDKVFGFLSSSNSTNLNSLWSLTDEEIEKNEWNREKDEPEEGPDRFFSNRGGKESNGFRAELEKDILDLGDGGEDDLNDDEEEQARDSRASSSKSGKDNDGYNDEEWDVKSNIGMDCTLDNEQEEDAYDKVAIGKEKPEDRIYMKDVNDYGIETYDHNELPESFKDVARDPRANHIAARIRLKEDEEAAKKMDTLHVSEQYTSSSISTQINPPEDNNLKSILKRSDTQSESRPNKRVRFDSNCKIDSDGKTTEEDTDLDESFNLPPDNPSGVPDYMRNPSKYTKYTFDEGVMDDESNKRAFMDFLDIINKNKNSESDEGLFDLPKSVTFVPRKKTVDATVVENNMESKENQVNDSKESVTVNTRNLPPGIAVRVAEDDETSAMEEDITEKDDASRKGSSQKSDRKYRMKPSLK